MRTTIGAILLTLAMTSSASATLMTEAPTNNDRPVKWAKKTVSDSFSGFTENSPYIKVRCWFTHTDRGGNNRYTCKARYVGDRLNALVTVKERFSDDIVDVWLSHLKVYH